MDETKKNKIKTAVALSYEAGEEAPKVVASGRGAVAERMLQIAEESNVPVHEDEKLANTLAHLEIGELIPPELYEVVAEVLVFVDQMDQLKEKITKQ